MANIGDTFSKLKQNIVGTKTDKIDSQLNDTIKDISVYRNQSGSNDYIELVRSIISKSGSNNMFSSSTAGLFSNQDNTPSSFGQGKRIQRYKSYESIVNNISHCKRALDVLVGNILSPDDITKMSLEVKSENYLTGQTNNQSINKIKSVIKEVKIDDNLSEIVSNTLLYGDYFCEIADSKTALTSKSILSEHEFFNDLSKRMHNGERETVYNENEIKVTLNYSSFLESNDKDNKSKDPKSEGYNLNNLNLVFHEPKRVVKLQSEMFPLCFGYLIFPKHNYSNLYGSPQEQPVNDICRSILKSLKSKIPQIEEFNNDEELKDIIQSMIKENDQSKVMNIRYVQPERMVHFKIPTTEYYPYGESIFDPCQFDAKVLMSLKTALAIQRLAKSTEKRKIGVEIGLPKDAAEQIQKLKEEFRKRKISLDDMGSIDTIPSMIGTFEDIYIPQKDGKQFVEIDSMDQGNVDTRSKVEELEYMRNSIVASLGVPNAFLNLEEELSNKAALSEENILFARTVITHQKNLNPQIKELIEKIMKLHDPEKGLVIFEDVNVSFPSPRSLQYERESRYIGELVTLIENLERIDVPKDYAKRKYLSQIDWDDVDNWETNKSIDDNLGGDDDEEDEMGGF